MDKTSTSDTKLQGNWFKQSLFKTMQYNLLWYTPLFIWVIIYFVVQNIISGYHNSITIYRRFSLLIFVSPSAYLYFTSLITSVFLPIKLCLIIPAFFEKNNRLFNKRYLCVFGIIAIIWLSALIIQFILWGSFPLPVDKQGYIRVRMIPFLPWPDAPFIDAG